MFTNVQSKEIGSIMEESGHNFEVTTVPLTMPNGKPVPDKVATVRTDTGSYLGTVGIGYQVVQPTRFYELAQRFQQETNAVPEQTITLKGGAIMGISFAVDTAEYLPGDPIQMLFLMMTAFNMSYSILGRAITNRLVCLNQLPSSTKLFDIKHTTNCEFRLDTAMKMLKYYASEKDEFDRRMRSLVRYRMSDGQAIEWFNGLFPVPTEGSKRGETLKSNREAEFIHLLTKGSGADISGVRGSGYGCLNALTEFVNHVQGSRVKNNRNAEEVKWESTVFGNGNRLMQRGMANLVKMAQAPDGTFVQA